MRLSRAAAQPLPQLLSSAAQAAGSSSRLVSIAPAFTSALPQRQQRQRQQQESPSCLAVDPTELLASIAFLSSISWWLQVCPARWEHRIEQGTVHRTAAEDFHTPAKFLRARLLDFADISKRAGRRRQQKALAPVIQRRTLFTSAADSSATQAAKVTSPGAAESPPDQPHAPRRPSTQRLDTTRSSSDVIASGDREKIRPSLQDGTLQMIRNAKRREYMNKDEAKWGAEATEHQQAKEQSTPKDNIFVHLTRNKLKERRKTVHKLFGKWKAAQRSCSAPGEYREHVATLIVLAEQLRDFPITKSSLAPRVAEVRTQIAGHMTTILEHIGTYLASDKERDMLAETCLSSEACSLRGDEEGARRALDDLRIQFGDVFQSAHRSGQAWVEERMKRERSPIIYVANALASLIKSVLHRLASANDVDAADDAASDTLIWMLDAPQYFDFIIFANKDLDSAFNTLMMSHKNITHVVKGYFQSRRCKPSQIEKATKSILLALVARDELRKGADFFRWACSNDVHLPEVALRRLLRQLSLHHEYISANRVVTELLKGASQQGRRIEMATLKTIAMHGLRSKVRQQLDSAHELMRRFHPDRADEIDGFVQTVELMYAAAIGDSAACRTNLSRVYDMAVAPDQKPGAGLKRPDVKMFRLLVQTYLKAGQIDEAQQYMAQQIRFGIKPGLEVLNPLLNYYARRGDVTAALSLFESMQRDVKPNIITYTNLIVLFARTKDVTSATNVVNTMRSRGVRMDAKALGALLNAHVEAGGWQGAMQLFESMESSENPKLRPGSSEYNTMLKAHVQRALPVQQTFRFLKTMLNKGFEPSAYTYSLTLQAACDAGMMRLAEDIFTNIERRLGGRMGMPPGKGANVWHFAIMIKSYHVINKHDTARDYLDELMIRQLPMTPALRNILISASSKEENVDDLEVTRELARSYAFENPDQILEIYQPLLQAATKRGQTGIVQSLLQEVVDQGIHVPIHVWSIFLDALRRENNADAALDLWKSMFEQALSTPAFDHPTDKDINRQGKVKGVAPSQRNILCIPLSIIIDVLTRTARYDEIAKIWIKCRQHGFGFDSHNWNHLAVALLRARRIDDGFGIIEHVLSSEPPTSEWRLREAHAEEMQKWRASAPSAHDVWRFLSSSLPSFRGEAEAAFGIETEGRAQTPQRPPNRRNQLRMRDDINVAIPSGLEDDEDLSEAEPAQDDDEEGVAGGDSGKSAEGRPDRDTPAQGSDYSPRPSRRQKPPRDAMLQGMVARDLLDRMQSPWFAHFETMQTLSELLDDARRSGGYITVNVLISRETEEASHRREPGDFAAAAGPAAAHKTPAQPQHATSRIAVSDVMQRYPRVRALLAAFDEKVEAIRERARQQTLR